MAKSSVQEYLLSLSEGLQSGGSGEFTIDLERALEKLSQFALEAPADIFLKVVQAGVAGRATRIDLTFTPGFLEVSLEGLQEQTAEAVGRALLPSGATSEPFVSELVVACRALLEQCRFRLSGDGYLEFSPGLQVESDPKHRERSDFKLQVERPKKGPLADLFLEPTHTDYRSFIKRLLWCPVPLSVNGHLIHPPLGTAAKRLRGTVRHMACYGAVKVQGTSFRWASPLVSEKSEEGTYVPVHSPMKRGKPWAEFWCVATHGQTYGVDLHEQPRLAQFVRHGVICAEMSLSPSLAGGRLVLHEDGTEGGLSGLSLQPSWSEDELNTAFKTLWEDCLGRIRSSLDQFPKPPDFVNVVVEVPRRKFSVKSLMVALIGCIACFFPIVFSLSLILGGELALLVYALICCFFLGYGYRGGFSRHGAHNQLVEEQVRRKEHSDKLKADYWKSVRPKYALQELIGKCRS